MQRGSRNLNGVQKVYTENYVSAENNDSYTQYSGMMPDSGVRGVPSSTPPLPPNTKHVKDARIPLPTAWRRRLQCCSLTRANGGVLSRVPSQGLRKKAPGPSDLSILCFCVKDDDCGTLAESAAPPAAGRESVTSKQSNDLRRSRLGPVYNLDRRRAVAEKVQSRSAVIQTAIIMILPAAPLFSAC